MNVPELPVRLPKENAYGLKDLSRKELHPAHAAFPGSAQGRDDKATLLESDEQRFPCPRRAFALALDATDPDRTAACRPRR